MYSPRPKEDPDGIFRAQSGNTGTAQQTALELIVRGQFHLDLLSGVVNTFANMPWRLIADARYLIYSKAFHAKQDEGLAVLRADVPQYSIQLGHHFFAGK